MSTETPQTLLLDSPLEIRNFRCFQHLQIEKLGRVNLIVGENGVGKTALLEALHLYANPTDADLIKLILKSRDDYLGFSAFFHGRVFDANVLPDSIEIGLRDKPESKLSFYLHPVRHTNEVEEESSEEETEANSRSSREIGIKIGYESKEFRTKISVPQEYESLIKLLLNENRDKERIRAVFVSAKGLVMDEMERFWNKSILSNKKKEIIIALNIVPAGERIEDLTFIRFENSRGRFPVVQIAGLENAVSLRSLGEGMVRMLGLALALANAKDGMLLVDEIESGLHYSIQAAMWNMIFKTAAKLNVQVFATTHSWDCVEGFQQAAQENEDIEGMLIRLKRRGDAIVPTLFDERRLAIATREQIEVR